MERFKERPANTDVYSRVKLLPLNEIDRQVALNALRDAETIVDACARAWKSVKGLLGGGTLNPSLK